VGLVLTGEKVGRHEGGRKKCQLRDRRRCRCWPLKEAHDAGEGKKKGLGEKAVRVKTTTTIMWEGGLRRIVFR